jgi:ActR/RegA family two-component response regulator
MARILLIDDDEVCLDITGRLLQLHGHEFSGARTGEEGLRVAHAWKPDVALVDLRLPDLSGIDVLAQLKAYCPGTSRVMFSGFATLETAVDAMRLGVCDCLTKPAFEEDIVAAVERALAQSQRAAENSLLEPALIPPEAHAAERWAQPIVRIIDAHQDPRTLREFGRAVFVSVGCFRNWCHTTRVSSRASLSFARALRAVYRFEHDQSTRPENLLSIVDQRTIVKFVKKCGGHGDRLPDSVAEFLQRQQLVTNQEAVDAVRRALQNRASSVVRVSTAREPRSAAADRAVQDDV